MNRALHSNLALVPRARISIAIACAKAISKAVKNTLPQYINLPFFISIKTRGTKF